MTSSSSKTRLDPGDRVVTIVTGASSGVGFAIVQRLIETHYTLGQEFIIVMACRNLKRATQAKNRLIRHLKGEDRLNATSSSTSSPLQILNIDLSSPLSVYEASREIVERFSRIDRVYLNSGILNIKGISLRKFMSSILCKGPTVTCFTGGGALIQSVGDKDGYGSGLLFITNVMGHYALLRNIESLMEKSDLNSYPCKSMVVWVSSGTATSVKDFDFNDIEGIKSEIPYEHSKRLCEIVAAAMESGLLEKNILTFVMSPGVCVSNIARNNFLSKICIVLGIILFKILGVPGANVFPYYSAYAAADLALRTTGSKTPKSDVVHMSHTNLLFKSSTFEYQIDTDLYSQKRKADVYKHLDKLYSGRYNYW